MSQVIRISDELYRRLEVHALGFDTPSRVIETILNAYEEANLNVDTHTTSHDSKILPSSNLDIIYFADSEESFKQQLLVNKKAYVKLFYTNDTSEIKEWDASKFSDTSQVAGNLRSGYLRSWKKRGIFKAELTINRNDFTQVR